LAPTAHFCFTIPQSPISASPPTLGTTDVIKGLHVARNNTENLYKSIRAEVATWVSEHSVQKTSVAAFMGKCCRYYNRQNFANMILRKHYKIHWLISSPKRKCVFMQKSDIKSCPSATDSLFPG